MNKDTFRFDIQSLRAISVILVIFYHFNFTLNGKPLFPGGFIGVDIFFIISGYVISNLILKEIREKNNFEFFVFFEKRLRRLIPALYFFLFVIFLISLFFLLPSRLLQLSYDVIFNILLSSNFYFWDSLQLYGAIVGIERPLLHTWSLSVEWQFYIITSFLFVLFRKSIINYFNFYFFSLFLISFFLNFFLLKNQINFNFYFSGSRYWEFLLGILIKYNEEKFTTNIKKFCSDKILDLILFLSLLIIIFFSITYDYFVNKKIFFMITMLSASIIVLLGSSKTTFLKFFSSKSLVFIGAISYSLYIWHYPIASFFYATENQNHFTNYTKLIVLIPLFLIASFSYAFIENIFRRSNFVQTKTFLSLFLISSIILISMSIFTQKNYGFVDRIKISDEQKMFIMNYNENRKKPINYKVKIEKNKKTILVLGNSHGGEFFEILVNNKYLSEKYNIIYSLIQIECLKNHINNRLNSNCFRKPEFKKERDFQNKMKLIDQIDIVILKTRWNEKDLKILPKAIKYFKEKNIDLIITSANPEFNIIENSKFDGKKNYKNALLVNTLFQKSTIIDKYFLSNKKLPDGNDLKKMEQDYFSRVNWHNYNMINKTLIEISKNNNVKFVDDLNLLCNLKNKSCSVLFENSKIHWDIQGHTTLKSKKFLSDRILKITKLGDYL